MQFSINSVIVVKPKLEKRNLANQKDADNPCSRGKAQEKSVLANHGWIWFKFWLDEKVAQAWNKELF